jgi:hypothetical protein
MRTKLPFHRSLGGNGVLPGSIPTGLPHSAQFEYSRRSSVCTPGSIPTGLHHSAQGCSRRRTTLGPSSPMIFNPNGVVSLRWYGGIQVKSVRKRSPAGNIVVPGNITASPAVRTTSPAVRTTSPVGQLRELDFNGARLSQPQQRGSEMRVIFIQTPGMGGVAASRSPAIRPDCFRVDLPVCRCGRFSSRPWAQRTGKPAQRICGSQGVEGWHGRV